MTVGGAAWAGLAVAGVLGGAGGLLSVASMAWQHRRGMQVVQRIPAEQSPTGRELVLRRIQLNGARVEPGREGIALFLPQGLEPERGAPRRDGRVEWLPARPVTLEEEAARRVLSRALVDANEKGATRSRLEGALGLLAEAGGADAYLRGAVRGRQGFGLKPVAVFARGENWRSVLGTFRGEIVPLSPQQPTWWTERRERMPAARALALEMALHEESERRALEGELAALEAAWRDAEAIAAIADVLPEDPLARLGAR